jgi:hypothetical protein
LLSLLRFYPEFVIMMMVVVMKMTGRETGAVGGTPVEVVAES